MLPWLPPLWLVLQKKKKKKTVQFGFHVFVDDEKVEKMKKMKNVMKKFYENFTFYEKVPSHLDPFRVFFFIFLPRLRCDVFN